MFCKQPFEIIEGENAFKNTVQYVNKQTVASCVTIVKLWMWFIFSNRVLKINLFLELGIIMVQILFSQIWRPGWPKPNTPAPQEYFRSTQLGACTTFAVLCMVNIIRLLHLHTYPYKTAGKEVTQSSPQADIYIIKSSVYAQPILGSVPIECAWFPCKWASLGCAKTEAKARSRSHLLHSSGRLGMRATWVSQFSWPTRLQA